MKEKIEVYRKELDLWEGYLEKVSRVLCFFIGRLGTNAAGHNTQKRFGFTFQSAAKGGFLCGEFSMADVAMFPVLALHVRVGLKLGEKRPHLQAYYNRVRTSLTRRL